MSCTMSHEREQCDHDNSGALAEELLDGKGYAVLRGVLSPEQCARGRQLLSGRSLNCVWVQRSQRILEPLLLDPAFFGGEVLGALPFREAFERVLGPSLQLGSYHALVLHPESAPPTEEAMDAHHAMNLHADYPFGHANESWGNAGCENPNALFTCQALWMLTDFTHDNGRCGLLWCTSQGQSWTCQ